MRRVSNQMGRHEMRSDDKKIECEQERFRLRAKWALRDGPQF